MHGVGETLHHKHNSSYAPAHRAEEHLPNTLRQVLIYDALKFPRPIFSHVSLILAPDKSKLSKRWGLSCLSS
jgi:glutamyl/glutaminyl-tRNA synthetase